MIQITIDNGQLKFGYPNSQQTIQCSDMLANGIFFSPTLSAVGCGQNLIIQYIQIDTQQGNINLQQQISVPQIQSLNQIQKPFENMQMILIDSNNKVYFATIKQDNTVSIFSYNYDYSSFVYFDSYAQLFLASQQNQLIAYFNDKNQVEEFTSSDPNLKMINFTALELQKASTVTQLTTYTSQIGSLYVLNSNDFGICNSGQNQLIIYQYNPTVSLKFKQNVNCVSMVANTYPKIIYADGTKQYDTSYTSSQILLQNQFGTKAASSISQIYSYLNAYQIIYTDNTSSSRYYLFEKQQLIKKNKTKQQFITIKYFTILLYQLIFVLVVDLSKEFTILAILQQSDVNKILFIFKIKQVIPLVRQQRYQIQFQQRLLLNTQHKFIQFLRRKQQQLKVQIIIWEYLTLMKLAQLHPQVFLKLFKQHLITYLLLILILQSFLIVICKFIFLIIHLCLKKQLIIQSLQNSQVFILLMYILYFQINYLLFIQQKNANYLIAYDADNNIMKIDLSSSFSCFSQCSTCYGSGSTQCGSCIDGYYYDPANSTCNQCTPPCLTCSSLSTCQTCQSGQYLNSSQTCVSCSTGCSSCNQSGCLQCSDSSASVNASKVCVCQSGFYLMASGVCQACSLGCSTCNQNECLQCSDSKASPNASKVCVCQDGFYLDSNGACQACNSTCLTCSSQNVCTSCDSSIQFRQLDSQTKTCNCLSGYIQVPGQDICQKCTSPCLVCTSLTACQTCQSGYYLNSQNSCSPCSIGCSNCNQNGCLQCSDSKAQPDSNNVCVCQNGYYLDSNGVCKVCSVGCAKCNQNGCLQCSDSKAQPNSSNVCVCQSGYYLDSNGVCQPCSLGCSKCNQNGCLQCSDSKAQPNSSNVCVCQSGYNLDSNGVCQPCSLGCSKCNQNGCLQCNDVNAQPNTNNICVCKDGSYLDSNGVCQSCNSTCLTCSNKNVCTSCNSLVQFRQLDNLANTCVCKQGYSQVTGSDICQQNDQSCQTSYCQVCQNTNQCTQCQSSYYLFLNTCVSSCPQGYEPNQANQCTLVVKIYYQITEFESNKFKILFDQNLTNANQLSQTINVDVLSFSGKYSFQSQLISNNTIIVTISPNSVPSSQNYTITFLFDQNSQSNLFSYTQQVSGLLTYQASGTSQKATEAISKAAEISSKATVASLLPLAISGNFQFIASAVDVSQLIYLLNFINLDFPYNLDSFYNSVKDVKIPFENFFVLLEDFHEVEYKSPEKFEFKKIQGFYLENFGEYFSLILTILMTNFIVYLIEMGLRIKPVWQKYVNIIRTKLFTLNLYFEFLFVIYIELTVAIVLQVQQFQYNHHIAEIVNYILLFFGLGISLIPIALMYLIYNKKLTNQIHSISENSSFQYYYPIQYIRKYYYSIVIGGFGFSPFVQLICLNIWNLFMLCLVIKTKPNKHKSYNCRDIISSFFFLTSTSLLFLFMVPKFSNEESQMLLGWIVIGNLIFIIILELGFFIKEVLAKVFQFLKHAKEKLQKKEKQIALNKVAPMSPTSTKQENPNICEDSLQKDQQEDVKQNAKNPPLSIPGMMRPMHVSIKQQNSNSTHDAVERQEISMPNESPTKTQKLSPLPSSSNLRGNSSTFNLFPSYFQKSSSFLRPPSLQFDRKTCDQQSVDFGIQGQESQNLQVIQKINDKDMASSERVLIHSPESKLISLTLKRVDKTVPANQNGLEYIPIIQSSEILKNFVQEQQPTDRKRIEKPQFNKVNKNSHRRVMEKLKSFHVNLKDEK
ncbi:hypothetical protein ABPG72_015380 [Tetrahymena utriculariae]